MPRNRPRRRSERVLIHALQDLRLKGLETGQYEPLSDRETFYLHLFQGGHGPDRADFIVSPPLFRLETIQRQMRDATDADIAFTPAPEPAISPP